MAAGPTTRAILRRLRMLAPGLVIPAIAAGDFVASRRAGLQPTPDGALLRSIASNLRHHLSFSAPTDQSWIVLSPAETWQRMPRVPVADVAPLYPTLMAALPAPLEFAEWAVNLASLVAALTAVFLLGRRLGGSRWTGVAAQVLLVAGPIQQTVFFRHSILDVAAAETYDVTALAFMLWAFVRWERTPQFIALLTAACLTRYAYSAIPAALLAAELARWGWTRRRPAMLKPAAAVTAIALGWQYVVWPLLTDAGSAPKPIAWHPSSLRPLLVAIGGWVGLDGRMARWPWPVSVALLAVLAAVVVHLLRRSPERSLAGMLMVAGAASLAMTVTGSALLVADLLVNDERHLLPVRVTVTLLACTAVTVAWRAVASRSTGSATTKVTLAATIAAVAVTVASMHDPFLADRRDSRLRVVGLDAALADYRGAALMSTSPAWLWDTTGHGALDTLRAVEPNTGRPRNPDAELADLALLTQTVILVRPTDDLANFSTVDLSVTCAHLEERRSFVGGTIDVFTLEACRA